ncbi:CrfX protein [Stutzerimonas kirkiae]|uniref:CrfX protein n=1 Tax=Stutzerimonas kirkiae TaxID=2211392 RepID=A0A4Q9RDY0_9GAMM|nr:CrfX protein [Stutzerimonas kirkiae]TBU99934.1 CrfX protein [Stutzerimonas kirkiae]TBV05640.1 CrfX protein [Stutzerimonas kirkiae]TBV10619.1 CrfX protein [Stutzerimonas kirkiae]TBV17474.1 CrfX protein [Stutzerimonas kirkiae]
MRDPFEESLRDLLNKPSIRDDDARLGRVLKTANRQVGAGDILSLIGCWLQALLIALSGGSRHVMPASRRHSPSTSFDKAD